MYCNVGRGLTTSTSPGREPWLTGWLVVCLSVCLSIHSSFSSSAVELVRRQIYKTFAEISVMCRIQNNFWRRRCLEISISITCLCSSTSTFNNISPQEIVAAGAQNSKRSQRWMVGCINLIWPINQCATLPPFIQSTTFFRLIRNSCVVLSMN